MPQNTDPSRPNYVARTPNAVEAARRPVIAKNGQDKSVDSNNGKTYTAENGNQPPQPNPSSLRQ